MQAQNQSMLVVFSKNLKELHEALKILPTALKSKNRYPGINFQQNGNASSEERNSQVALIQPS